MGAIVVYTIAPKVVNFYQSAEVVVVTSVSRPIKNDS
jgi:hypothetical protein